MSNRVAARWRLGCRGLAAVEFAIFAPVLLILLLGTAEILTLYRTESKLNQLTSNFAEMVSLQVNSPVATTGAPGLTDLCTGAANALQPFPPLGLTIAVASVTEMQAVPFKYGEWETDLTSACGTTTTQTGAMAVASPILQGVGDNVIVVRASLKYPGVLGLFLTAAVNLTQTAVARWRYASSTNINTTSNTTPSTLEFLCTGANCNTHSCTSSTTCT
jgi:hypothetical protein